VKLYRILLERPAEEDLGRVSSEIYDRLIAAIQSLALNPVRQAAANSPDANRTGASAWQYRLALAGQARIPDVPVQLPVLVHLFPNDQILPLVRFFAGGVF
jgi:hypothetical protein